MHDSGAGHEAIRVGLNFGVTGELSQPVADAIRGIELGFDECNWEINGRRIELIRTDNATNPAKALENARQLVEVDNVTVMFGPIFGPSAMLVSDYLQASGTPNLHATQPFEIAKFGGGKNIFVTCGYEEKLGETMGRFLYQDLKLRTAAAVFLDYLTAETIVTSALDSFRELGGEVVQVQRTPVGTQDFTACLDSIRPADVVLFWSFGPAVPAFINQFRASGIQSRLAIPANGVCGDDVVATLGDAAVGVLGAGIYSSLIENEENERFVTGFKARFGKPPGIGWPWYLNTKIFLEAARAAAGDFSHEAVNRALQQVKVKTFAGEVSYLPSGGSIADMKVMEVVRIAEGAWGWKVIAEYEQAHLGPM